MSHIPQVESVAKKVRKLRRFQALSVRQLALQSDLSVRTIQRIENGDTVSYNTKLNTLEQLSKGLGVRVGLLLDVPVKHINKITHIK